MKPDEIKHYKIGLDFYRYEDDKGEYVLAADHDRVVAKYETNTRELLEAAAALCAVDDKRYAVIAELQAERDALTERLREGAQVLKELADDINDRFDMQSISTNPGMREAVAAAYAWLQREGST